MRGTRTPIFENLPTSELSPELLRAARWVEANARDVALQSMRECARRAALTPATFTRLAQTLGFDGFDAIKARCQDLLAPQTEYAARAQALQLTAGLSADWLESLNSAQHANTASVNSRNQREQFERAADAMLAARAVHFLGLRASHGLAFYLNYTYGLLASNGSLVQGLGGTLADQLWQVQADDLVVAISVAPYTRQTVEGVEQVRQAGGKILALTDSPMSPIARLADQVLLYRAASPSYFQSMVGGLALAEALVAAVAIRGGAKVLDRLQSVQRKLDAQGAYWEKMLDAAPGNQLKKSPTNKPRKLP